MIQSRGSISGEIYCRRWVNFGQSSTFTLKQLGLPATQDTEYIARIIGCLATYFNMSLRDIERAATLYSFGQPFHGSAVYVAWPIALKIAKPNLFARLLSNSREAHEEAKGLAGNVRNKLNDIEPMMTLMALVHDAGLNGFAGPHSNELMNELRNMSRRGGPREFFTWLFERVDLEVSK